MSLAFSAGQGWHGWSDCREARLLSPDGKRHLRVQVALPDAPPPPGGYGVLYLLDGNAAFDALRTLALPPVALVLVGLGYDVPHTEVKAGRTYDYTPPRPGGPAFDPRTPTLPAGGADDFLDDLALRIRPAVAELAPLDPTCQSLYGHSYGGLCVLYALLTRPGGFQRYLCISPSIWWADEYILSLAPGALARYDGPPLEILGMVGEVERRYARPASEEPRTPENGVPTLPVARDLIARLGRLPGVKTAFQGVPEATHGQMLAASLPRALTVACDGLAALVTS